LPAVVAVVLDTLVAEEQEDYLQILEELHFK
jgi:hypothetical protein